LNESCFSLRLKELENICGVKRRVRGAVVRRRRFPLAAVDSEAGFPSEKALARRPKPL